jgi:hypothetical protein
MAAVKPVLYLLSILTCLGCTVLLVRQYRRARARLLMWSALCFIGLSVANILLYVDLVLTPDLDLRIFRHSTTLASLACLLYGFIRDSDA